MGQNAKWDKTPNGTKRQMGQNAEWKKCRMVQNVEWKNAEWDKTLNGKMPNGTKR
jgi:hypothetical protein